MKLCLLRENISLDNGDISSISGVDFDTMQNMSIDVMRNQERDFHKDAVEICLKNSWFEIFWQIQIYSHKEKIGRRDYEIKAKKHHKEPKSIAL